MTRYPEYNSEPANSVDVVFIGPSTTWFDIAPSVVWEESGITSYNMAMARQVPFIEYYQMLYLIKTGKPKLAVLEISNIWKERDLDASLTDEVLYQAAVASMPDRKLKMELLDLICSIYTSQEKKYYLVPLLRYHERWSDLGDVDFRPELLGDYRSWVRGGQMKTDIVPQEWGETNEELLPKIELYEEYYQKLADLCRDNDIELMLQLPPRLAREYVDIVYTREFAEKNGLKLLEFSSEEAINKAGFDLEKDFYDPNHMNVFGQKKFSVILADYMKENYELTDHRKDESYKKWEEDKDAFEQKFEEAKLQSGTVSEVTEVEYD